MNSSVLYRHRFTLPDPFDSFLQMNKNKNIISKLEQALADGDFYTSHQVYNTLIARLFKQNNPQALPTLYNAARTMFTHTQIQSGLDLLDQLLKHPLDLSQISDLFSLVPLDAKAQFIKRVTDVDDRTDVHYVFGLEYFQLDLYWDAMFHLVKARAVALLKIMVFQYQHQEVVEGYLITIAVLMLIHDGAAKEGAELLDLYLKDSVVKKDGLLELKDTAGNDLSNGESSTFNLI